MRISHYQLRTLIESVIFEGFQSDQRYLAEKYPEHSQDIFRLQSKWISWLMARFGDSPTQKEIHPFSDAIVTVLNFSKKDAAIGEKWKSNEQFRAAINARFPEGERSWRSPTDATTMTVDQMELIFGLAERKKQKVEFKDENFEDDRVGKVGPWNVWLPTTRENSCKIAGYDPITMEPKTTWCTARTAGSNVFYNYIGRPGADITLFYIIKDNPIGDEDWLSLGFVNGKPQFDGHDGGFSVNRANKGLTASRLKSILGQHYNEIMNIAVEKNKSLGGKHPASEKISAAARSVEALEYLLKGLSKDEANDVKKIVSRDPDLHPDVIKFFAEDSDKDIRMRIAMMRNNVSQDVLRKLAEDPDSGVRVMIAQGLNTPQDILRKLAEDPEHIVRMYVVHNNNTSVNIFYELAEDSHPSVRAAVAQSLKTPQDILRKLAEDPETKVKLHVINNANTQQDILRKLAGDSNWEVRRDVAQIKNTPDDVLQKLAGDTEYAVRAAIASRQKILVNILRRLAEDPEPGIRLIVAGKTNIPQNILRRLAEDPELNVRAAAAKNAKIPQDILYKFSEDPEHLIRRAIARNKATSQDILNKLAEDPEWQVRNYAEISLNNQQKKILKLKQQKAGA